MIEYFSKNSSKISYFPVFPTLAKFGVFPRTVITGNYRWEFPPPVFPGQPWQQAGLALAKCSSFMLKFFMLMGKVLSGKLSFKLRDLVCLNNLLNWKKRILRVSCIDNI